MGAGNTKTGRKKYSFNDLKTFVSQICLALKQDKLKRINDIKKQSKLVQKLIIKKDQAQAKQKVEEILAHEDFIAAINIILSYCPTIKENVPVIMSSFRVPDDMRPNLDALVYASTRMNIEEFQKVRRIIGVKFGEQYIQAANINKERLVNPEVVARLEIKTYDINIVNARIEKIAAMKSIEFSEKDIAEINLESEIMRKEEYIEDKVVDSAMDSQEEEEIREREVQEQSLEIDNNNFNLRELVETKGGFFESNMQTQKNGETVQSNIFPRANQDKGMNSSVEGTGNQEIMELIEDMPSRVVNKSKQKSCHSKQPSDNIIEISANDEIFIKDDNISSNTNNQKVEGQMLISYCEDSIQHENIEDNFEDYSVKDLAMIANTEEALAESLSSFKENMDVSAKLTFIPTIGNKCGSELSFNNTFLNFDDLMMNVIMIPKKTPNFFNKL